MICYYNSKSSKNFIVPLIFGWWILKTITNETEKDLIHSCKRKRSYFNGNGLHFIHNQARIFLRRHANSLFDTFRLNFA